MASWLSSESSGQYFLIPGMCNFWVAVGSALTHFVFYRCILFDYIHPTIAVLRGHICPFGSVFKMVGSTDASGL